MGPVEHEDGFIAPAVLHFHLTGACHVDQDKLGSAVGVLPPDNAPFRAVDVKYACDIERDILHPFDDYQMPPLIPVLGELQHLCSDMF